MLAAKNFRASRSTHHRVTLGVPCMVPMPTGRGGHAAVAVGSAMYVLSGYDGGTIIASVLKCNNTQGTWSKITPMPTSRSIVASYTVGSDIHVFDGHDGAQRHAMHLFFNTTQSPMSGAPWRPASCMRRVEWMRHRRQASTFLLCGHTRICEPEQRAGSSRHAYSGGVADPIYLSF
jgi:hypothetical protein